MVGDENVNELGKCNVGFIVKTNREWWPNFAVPVDYALFLSPHIRKPLVIDIVCDLRWIFY